MHDYKPYTEIFQFHCYSICIFLNVFDVQFIMKPSDQNNTPGSLTNPGDSTRENNDERYKIRRLRLFAIFVTIHTVDDKRILVSNFCELAENSYFNYYCWPSAMAKNDYYHTKQIFKFSSRQPVTKRAYAWSFGIIEFTRGTSVPPERFKSFIITLSRNKLNYFQHKCFYFNNYFCLYAYNLLFELILRRSAN